MNTDKYTYSDHVKLDTGFTIVKDEIFKIRGTNSFGVSEWGAKFKFYRLVTNVENGRQWVDCYELFRGQPGVMRSFPVDRIKRIPKKRRRKIVR